MSKTFIYELFYKENNIPFYVGKTKNPTNRKRLHKKKYGDVFIMNIIDYVNDNEWKFWEKHYISLYKSWGFNLENKNNGGGGPTCWTEEQKKNHSKYYTQEIRDKISKNLKGIPRPEVSKWMKGKSNFKGKKHTDEYKEKQSKMKLGKKIHSDKSKDNISKKMKEQWKNNPKLKNRPISKEYPSARTHIIQYNLDGNFIKEWIGINEAAKALCINKRGISNCLLKISKNSGGYVWKYK